MSSNKRDEKKASAVPEGAPKLPQEPLDPGRGEAGRFTSRRKTEAVLRLFRGEDLDRLSRELGVTGATLSVWRDQFLAAGQASLKSRPADEKDDEIQRLRAKVGEITMANELLLDRCHAMEAKLPLAPWRRKL